MKLSELAGAIDAEFQSSVDPEITCVRGLQDAGHGDITFLSTRRHTPCLLASKASAVILSEPVHDLAIPAIYVKDPSSAATNAAQVLGAKRPLPAPGISPKASIHPSAKIGADVCLMDYCVIDQGVEVGDRTIVYPFTYLGQDVTVGADCLFYSNVSILDHSKLGHRVIIHSGTVIGSDGFGIDIAGGNDKIPQLGSVEIGDDVEIGACVTIDRARFDRTKIGRGTKIDNQVQIAHNTVIGDNCIVVAQSGLAGSTRLGDRVVLAARAGLNGHISIADDVKIGACAIVKDSINEPGARYGGAPAMPVKEFRRHIALLANLGKMRDKLESLVARVEALESEADPAASQD